MRRFVLSFLVLLVVLFTLELTPPAQQFVVQPWTGALARLSAALAALFDPAVAAHGKVLHHLGSGVGVAIEPGCNGIEACLILAAAILAYPARWPLKAAGIVLGFVAIQAVNVLRVLTLFYLAGWKPVVFEFAHLYLWQALIMIDVLAVWLAWVRHATRDELRRACRPAGALGPSGVAAWG